MHMYSELHQHSTRARTKEKHGFINDRNPFPEGKTVYAIAFIIKPIPPNPAIPPTPTGPKPNQQDTIGNQKRPP